MFHCAIQKKKTNEKQRKKIARKVSLYSEMKTVHFSKCEISIS